MTAKKFKPSSLILRSGPADDLRRTMVEGATPPVHAPAHTLPSVVAPLSSPGTYLVGQVYEIPVSEIRDNHLNARVHYANTEVEKMGLSMNANGQDVAARGYVDNGALLLIDGQKRWRGAIAVGRKTLRVEICEPPVSPKAAYLESRRINSERSEQTVLDDAVRFKDLLDNSIFSGQTELGAGVGLDQATVSKILSINTIPDRLKRRMRDYEQLSGMRVACAIAQIFKPAETERDGVTLETVADSVIDEIIKLELSARQVEDLVRSRLAGPKTKVRSEIQNYKFEGQTVTVKLLPSAGKLDLSVKGLSSEKLTLLNHKIQEVLKGDAE